jgi:signal transduction histidine kinase
MRAHEMIADVMFFAHPPSPQRQAIDWAACVERAVGTFAERLADASIDWKLTNDSRAPIEVWGDPAMLHDAMAALLRNALEAVGEAGAIHLRLGKRGKRRPKAYVEVADSGPGMSAAAQRHAFDPYYSGREAGRGLGLGLCRVARVAELHGGKVKLTSGAGGCVARLTVRREGPPSP